MGNTILPKVNPKRFLELLKQQGQIGWDKDLGLQRLAYTENYNKVAYWFAEQINALGLDVRKDSVGNVFGRWQGKLDTTILLGSHLDSVINGGIYDGGLGVIGALEVVHALKDINYQPKYSIEVVGFIGEEGEPLGGTFGSRSFAGMIPNDYHQEKLAPFGLTFNDINQCKCNPARYKCFLEMHIEQGPVLERLNKQIGIPAGIVGISRCEVSIYGIANHAGTTPMHERQDALRAAADIIHDWYDYVDKNPGDYVCNIGVLAVKPGHVSVVPAEVKFCLEVRSQEDRTTDKVIDAFKKIALQHVENEVNITRISSDPAVKLNENMAAIIEETCKSLELTYNIMPSGASHDSSPIAHIMPTGMIFVPSHNGISHSKEEYTNEDDLINGVSVLLNTTLMIEEDMSVK